MKIISDLFGEIRFGTVLSHVFHFKSIEMEYEFLTQLMAWSTGKEIEKGRFFILKDQIEVTSKNANYFSFHGGQAANLDTKIHAAWLKDVIYNQDSYYVKYVQLKNEFELFLSQFTPSIGEYSVDFELINFTPEYLFKMTKQTIIHEEDNLIYPLDYRRITLSQWFNQQTNAKQAIVIYVYPEQDMNTQQLKQFMKFIHSKGGVFICISRNEILLKAFNVQQTHIIKASGMRYDLERLKLELLEFAMISGENTDAISIELALKDLDEDYTIMSEKYSEFLKSGKF